MDLLLPRITAAYGQWSSTMVPSIRCHQDGSIKRPMRCSGHGQTCPAGTLTLFHAADRRNRSDQAGRAQRIHRPTRLAAASQCAGRLCRQIYLLCRQRRTHAGRVMPGAPIVSAGIYRAGTGAAAAILRCAGPCQLGQRRITDRGKLGDGQGERAWAGVIACLAARACGPRPWPRLPSCSAAAACSAGLRRCRRTIR